MSTLPRFHQGSITGLSLFILLVHSLFSYAGGDHDPHYKFIENKGQWPDPVLFKASFSGGNMYLEKNRFTYGFYDYSGGNSEVVSGSPHGIDPSHLQGHAVRVNFLGANKDANLGPTERSTEYYNYFYGNDPDRWVSSAYAFHRVNYNSLYEGIDMELYTSNGSLKYDFSVQPGVDPAKIRLQYEGADRIAIEKGNLVVRTSINEIIEERPFAYQIINGEKTEIPCAFDLKDSTVSFEFPQGFDPEKELIIDPVLVFASYSGSSADNFGMTATPGNDGSLFAGGMAYNNGYPTTSGAYDETFAGTPSNGIADVVITKYDSTGSSHIYSTYIGGTGTETVHSLIVNSNDELFLYGVTSSTDFPTTTSAFDPSFNGGNTINIAFNGTRFNGGTDIYVTKLNATGTSLLGSTFVGGSGNDGVNYNVSSLPYNSSSMYDSLTTNYGDQFRGEVMLDKAGNCIIASSTRSSDFPIVNGFESTFQGQQDGVVLKFDANLSSLLWSTYLGGSDKDGAYSVKTDDSDNVYVTGGTASSNFPMLSTAYDNTYSGGITDAFIATISSDGTSLLNATYFGTSAYDQCFFLELDRFGNIYVVGQSGGSIPVINAIYSDSGSSQFITKFNNSLDSIIYSTVFGNGSSTVNISPAAFLVDRCENVYVSGWGANILQSTPLSGMPVTSDAHTSSPPNGYDFYLFVLERDADSLLYATYFGGAQSNEHVDGGTSRFDKNGIVYQSVCAGCGGNNDFPTTSGSYSQINQSSNCNNGVFKFDFQLQPNAQFTVSQDIGCQPFTVIFDNESTSSADYLWDFGNGDTTSQTFNPVRTFTDTGTFLVKLSVTDSICQLTDTHYTYITVLPALELTASGDTVICTSDTVPLTASSSSDIDGFIWSTTNDFQDTLNTSVQDSTAEVLPSPGTNKYYVLIENEYCSLTDSVEVQFDIFSPEIGLSDTSACAGIDINFTNNSQGITDFLWNFGNGDTTSTTMNPVRSFTDTGTHTITFIAYHEECNLSDTLEQTIKIFPSIELTTSPDTNLCIDDPVELWANSTGVADTFIWSSNTNFSDTLNSSVSDSTINVTPSLSQSTYYVFATNGSCVSTDSVTVNYLELVPQISATDSGCQPLTVTFENSSLNDSTYFWDFGNNDTTSTETSPIRIFSDTGTFIVTLTISNSYCNTSDTTFHSITVFPEVNLSLSGDTTICNGSQAILTATTSDSAAIFVWSQFADFSDTLNTDLTDSSISVSPFSNNRYYLLAENRYSCTQNDSVDVMVRSPQISISGKQELCGGSSTVLSAESSGTDQLSYSWSPEAYIIGTTDTSTITIQPEESTAFIAVATDTIGCKASDTIFISVSDLYPADVFATADDDTIFKGEFTILHAMPAGYSFSWEPPESLSDPSSKDPVASPLSTTEYSLAVSDVENAECMFTDTVTVFVKEIICGNPEIFVPNAFTPNGDGNNDLLLVRGQQYIKEMFFTVYDRWGEKMFETTDPDIGWDGNYKGMMSDPAVFVFYLEGFCVDGQEFFMKGNVSLIR